MQTSLRRRHRDRVVRRGLALIIESDFVRPCLKSMPGGLLLTRVSPPHAYPLPLRVCAAQYATDAGRQHFADQLTSIRYWSGGHALNPAYLAHTHTYTRVWCSHRPCLLLRSVQETCNFDALYAYLSTSNYDFAYDRAKNLCASLPPTQPPVHIHTAAAALADACLSPKRHAQPPQAQHQDGHEQRDHALRHCAEGAARL